MAPSYNPINVRTPYFDLESEEGRQAAHRYLASGIVDLNQAIAYLNSRITQSASASTTTTVLESSGGGGGQTPSLIVGGVNDQIGVTDYTTQQTDYGVKILVGDSSPVTVTLNSTVTTPWFTIIDNDSSSMVSLTTNPPATVQGENEILPGGFAIVYFDGQNFWSGATRIATDSSLGYVQPDNVTIGIDSGIVYTQISVDSGAPSYVPLTAGNPFYFDSSLSPWQGYVWWGGNWNKFS
jgi:hypothetical protein